VGRERELDALEKQYLLPESNLIPIYGRRRVGKSELILHFKGNRPGNYFVGNLDRSPIGLVLRGLF
jgi:AAA+ ATPase superfamily predicted ATPase